MRRVSHHILAALDGPPAEPAIRAAAAVMGEVLGLPVRTVHVASGPGPRGEARRSLLAQVQRGETTEVHGRTEDVLASLVESPTAELAVLGARQHPRAPGERRGAGTAIAVARRATRPLLFVPPVATNWSGPRRALTLLDGTGATAVAAASALTAISRPDTVAAALHVGDAPDHRHAPESVESSGLGRTTDGRATAVIDSPAVQAGRTGQQVLDAVTTSACDLVVMVWSRLTQGVEGAMVLDVLASSPVPVLLVPVSVPG